MKTVQLHGILADQFGSYFRLDIQTAREATHAIASQIPEFKKFMLESETKGLKFAVFVDEKNISEDDLDDLTSGRMIHIVPKVMGAGGDAFGWLQVITGAILVGVGVLGSFATAGLSTSLIGVGTGLMVGGAASLLMPSPDLGEQDPDGNRANYGFGGAVTTVAQGNSVPVLYGEREVGGFIVSAGIYTEDNQ